MDAMALNRLGDVFSAELFEETYKLTLDVMDKLA
jgi:hypothetical protein